MKRSLLLLFFFLFTFCVFAQSGSLNLTLKVYTKARKVLANTPITFTNESTGEQIVDTTNISGIVSLKLEGGKAWQIDILKIRRNPAWKILMPNRGSGKKKMDVVYNYEHYLRKTAPPVNRLPLNLITEFQKVKAKTKFTSKLARMNVLVTGIKHQPVKGITVSFVSYKLNKIFTATSDKKGMARFLLPVRQNYQIDLDGVENYNFKDIGKTGVYKLKCIYVPTNVQEQEINDTITQSLPSKITGTTAREHIILKLKLTKGGGISNEPVFLRESISGKVYKGKTDVQGTVHFLVPKGKIYAIDYTHEKEIDAFDLTYDQGIGHTGKEIMYESREFFLMTRKQKASYKKRLKEGYRDSKEQELAKNIQGEIGDIKPLEVKRLLFEQTNTSFAYEFIPIPTNDGEQQALFLSAIKTPEWSSENFQQSLRTTNLCLLIDVSGSMTGEMVQLKTAIKKYIDLISDESTLSIITFNDAPYLLLPPLSVKENRQYFKDQIDRLRVGGGTNIYNGLEAAYKELSKTVKKNKHNQVVMFTDGYGIRSTNDVMDLSVDYYQSKNIELAPIGVGDYHREFMELLAGGMGNYRHYSDNQNLEDYFQSCLLHAIQKPIITNYKNQFVFGKETRGGEILPLNHIMVNSPLKRTIKELSPAHYQEKIYKFIGEKSDIQFSITYKNEKTGEKEKINKTFHLNWNAQNTTIEEAFTIRQKRLLIRSEINHTMKKIVDANYQAIEKEISELLKLVKQLEVLNHDAEVKQIVQKLENVNKLITTFKLEVNK